MSQIRRSSSRLSRLKKYAPPAPNIRHKSATDPEQLERVSKKAMSLHDDLPPHLRMEAKNRQDFKLEEQYQKAKRSGYAPDVEDA